MPEEVQTEEALTLPSDIPHELILMAILNLELVSSVRKRQPWESCVSWKSPAEGLDLHPSGREGSFAIDLFPLVFARLCYIPQASLEDMILLL